MSWARSSCLRIALALAAAVALPGCEGLARVGSKASSPQDEANALVAEGLALERRGELKEARARYEKASTLAPADAAPHVALGRVWDTLGDEARAVLALRRALELAPDHVDSRVRLSRLYLRQGRADAALRAIGDPAWNPALGRAKAAALLKSGNPEAAEALLAELEQKDPRDGETLSAMAEVLLGRRQDERAFEVLERAVTVAPASPAVRAVRARYFGLRGRAQEALREYELAYEQDPADFTVAMGRARSLASVGRLEEATKAIERLIASRPHDLEAKVALADVMLLSGDAPAALELCDSVQQREPNNVRALATRARAIDRIAAGNDDRRAVNAWTQVLEADAVHVEALSRLGRLYLKLGQRADAITMLERLLGTPEATEEDERQLIELYAKTGINAGRGLTMVKAMRARHPEEAGLAVLERELAAKHRQLAPPTPAPKATKKKRRAAKGTPPATDEVEVVVEHE